MERFLDWFRYVITLSLFPSPFISFNFHRYFVSSTHFSLCPFSLCPMLFYSWFWCFISIGYCIATAVAFSIASGCARIEHEPTCCCISRHILHHSLEGSVSSSFLFFYAKIILTAIIFHILNTVLIIPILLMISYIISTSIPPHVAWLTGLHFVYIRIIKLTHWSGFSNVFFSLLE